MAGIIPKKSFLYMGADPAWTPAMEHYVDRPIPGSPLGRSRVPSRCSICGGLDAVGDDDPLYDGELMVEACGRCMRVSSRYEDKLKGDVCVPNPRRLGKVAARIKGKEDKRAKEFLMRSVAEESK